MPLIKSLWISTAIRRPFETVTWSWFISTYIIFLLALIKSSKLRIKKLGHFPITKKFGANAHGIDQLSHLKIANTFHVNDFYEYYSSNDALVSEVTSSGSSVCVCVCVCVFFFLFRLREIDAPAMCHLCVKSAILYHLCVYFILSLLVLFYFH